MITFNLQVDPGPTYKTLNGRWMLYLNRTQGDQSRYLAQSRLFTFILVSPDVLYDMRNCNILLCHILSRRQT